MLKRRTIFLYGIALNELTNCTVSGNWEKKEIEVSFYYDEGMETTTRE